MKMTQHVILQNGGATPLQYYQPICTHFFCAGLRPHFAQDSVTTFSLLRICLFRVRAKIHENDTANDTAKVHDKMVRFFLVQKKHVDKSLSSLLRPGGVGHSHFVGRLSCLAGLAIL